MFTKPQVIVGLLILLLAQMEVVCGQSSSQFTFEVLLHSYLNSESRDTTGQLCRSNINQGCRNRFMFCAARPTASAADCSLGIHEFNLDTGTSQMIFTDDINGVANPLTFTELSGPWPGGFSLTITVINRDRNPNVLVDEFTIQQDGLSSQPDFTPPSVFSGNHSIARIELSFRVSCTTDYHGPNCETLITAPPTSTQLPTEATDPLTTVQSTATTETTDPLTTVLVQSTATTDPLTTVAVCSTLNCMNGGTCVIITGEMTCRCSSLYEGDLCEVPIATNEGGTTTESTTNTTGEAGGLSGGGVAGIIVVIVILVVAVVGIAVGVVLWRRQTCASYSVKKDIGKKSVDNPVYGEVELQPNTSPGLSVSPAPVYASSQLNNVPTIEQTLDNDNPLYFSQSMEASDADYAVPPDALTSHNENDYAIPPDAHSSQDSSIARLQPYGEYGDGTIKRVASQQSVDRETALFDNPDYEMVS